MPAYSTNITGSEVPSDDVRAQWPAFIVGCHRSGTTLLRYLLDAHPDLACPPESKFIAGLEAAMRYPQALQGLASLGSTPKRLLDGMRQMVQSIFSEYASQQGKRRWIDKTPNYARLLPFLDALFNGEVLFLWVVRHPLDTVDSLASLVAFNVAQPDDPDIAEAAAKYGRTRQGWARYWVEVMQTLEWFVYRAQGRLCVVRYEDLVSDPAPTLESVLRFIGECVDRGTTLQMIADAFSQPHAPGYEDPKIRNSGGIHRASVDKWRTWPQQELEAVWAIVEEQAGVLKYTLSTTSRVHAAL